MTTLFPLEDRATTFDPSTFWTEVRRYGVTTVTYTWTLVRELLAAPQEVGERHHPIRLFLGSGMPANLWRQVTARFAPARVLELYASTEGEAVLANVAGRKVGSKGRPLPGSARVNLAAYDPVHGRLAEGPDGFAVACGPDEVGLLLARPRDRAATGTVLRGGVRPGRFLAGHRGPVPPGRRRGLLVGGPGRRRGGQRRPSGVLGAGGRRLGQCPRRRAGRCLRGGLGSGRVRPGRELIAAALSSALAALEAPDRPAYVAHSDAIPLTTWYRPKKEVLRAAGIPDPSGEGIIAVWRLDPRTGRYRAIRRR
ncbi:MAG: AMP-binding protein [Acidimicrobiales bacterium]